MIGKNIVKIIAVISLVINVILMCCLIRPVFDNVQLDSDTSRDIGSYREDKAEDQMYTSKVNRPLFYGTWKIVELIPAEIPQPSSVSGFNEEGEFRGPDVKAILGEEITFALNYAEYEGENYEYVCRPRTYSHPLSEDTQIAYNYAKKLGITGNYYSEVYFLLPGYDKVRVLNEPKVIKISDLRELYLKDEDTMYAHAYGGILYKLERVVKE